MVCLILRLSFDHILLVTYFQTISVPTRLIFILLFITSQRFKSITEKRIIFNKINYIYFNLLVLFGVSHLEIKPLIVPACINIILHYEVISLNDISFIVVLENIEQVTTLEMRIENNRSIVVINCFLLVFSFYLRQSFSFGIEVQPCNVHEQISKMVLFWSCFKSTIVQLFIMIHIP